MNFRLSIVPYNDGKFDVIFRTDGNEVTFSGEQKLTPEQLKFCAEIAPPCVWSKCTSDAS